jgi:hypothetical protein
VLLAHGLRGDKPVAEPRRERCQGGSDSFGITADRRNSHSMTSPFLARSAG